jgi:hypothetical protein
LLVPMGSFVIAEDKLLSLFAFTDVGAAKDR